MRIESGYISLVLCIRNTKNKLWQIKKTHISYSTVEPNKNYYVVYNFFFVFCFFSVTNYSVVVLTSLHVYILTFRFCKCLPYDFLITINASNFEKKSEKKYVGIQ